MGSLKRRDCAASCPPGRNRAPCVWRDTFGMTSHMRGLEVQARALHYGQLKNGCQAPVSLKLRHKKIAHTWKARLILKAIKLKHFQLKTCITCSHSCIRNHSPDLRTNVRLFGGVNASSEASGGFFRSKKKCPVTVARDPLMGPGAGRTHSPSAVGWHRTRSGMLRTSCA